MANEILGNGSLFKIDTLGDATYVAIANQLDGTLTTDLDAVEATNKSSSRNKTYISGNYGWSASLNGIIDSQAGGDTTGLVLAQTEQASKNLVDFQFLEDGTALTYTGDVIITSITRGYAQNGTQTYTINLQGSGALTIA